MRLKWGWRGEEWSEISGGGKGLEIAWLLYAIVSCGDSEESLRAMVGRFAEVCRRRGLKVKGVRAR